MKNNPLLHNLFLWADRHARGHRNPAPFTRANPSGGSGDRGGGLSRFTQAIGWLLCGGKSALHAIASLPHRLFPHRQPFPASTSPTVLMSLSPPVSKRNYFRFFSLTLVSAVLMFAIAGCNPGSGGLGGRADLVIGSKNFTEQVILGELVAQHIENQTDLTVDRRLNLGGTFICHTAVTSGDIDTYVEYTGTSLSAILEREPISNPQKVYNIVKEAYDEQFDLTITEPLGFENTYAIIIRGEDAEIYNLETISDTVEYTPEWQGGFSYEFIEREDGFPGLAETYNLEFAENPQVMDMGLMYRALVENKVDMVAGGSTDGLIQTLGLVVLEDDKNYFPPYDATPVIREATLQKYPQLREVYAQLGGVISEEEMRRMNYQVDGEFRRVPDVVREFLATKDFPPIDSAKDFSPIDSAKDFSPIDSDS